MSYASDRVRCQITLENETLTPEEISERVETSFEVAHRVGDPRGHTGKLWQTNVWQLREGQNGTKDSSAHDVLTSCIEKILRRVLPFSVGLRQVVGDLWGEFAIYVTSSFVPGIGLSNDQLSRIGDLGLSLDIDIVLSEGD